MSVSFLAPWALGLAVLAALPVVAHLSQQQPRDEVPFGAMMLLKRVVKRLRRRARLKDVMLFVMRVSAVVACVLAAAGLQILWDTDAPAVGQSGRVVVVLDTSMSMSQQDRGGSLLARARADVRRALNALPATTELGLVSYDDEAHVWTSQLRPGPEAILGMVDALEPGAGGSNLRAGLLEARRLLGGEPGEVMLFSDEAGAVQVPSAASEIARFVELGSAIVPRPIHAEPARNVAVTSATFGDGLEGGQVVVRVTNYGPDAVELPCEVVLPDGTEIPFFIDAPPLGPAESSVTVPRVAEGGVATARCEDAALPLDDAHYFHLPHVGASRVMIVDGDPGDTPTRSEVYFLERALAPWGGRRSGLRPDVVTPNGLASLDPEVHRVAVLANVSDPRPYSTRLTEFVQKGGALVIAVGDNVTADRYNMALGGLLPSRLQRPRALASMEEDPVRLALPDVKEPPFTSFSRGSRSALARVGSWRVMTVEPTSQGDTRTLLSYVGGLPALQSRNVGRGKVVLWTSTIDRGWSNMPLQAAYVPMMQDLIAWLGASGKDVAKRLQGTVGQPVTVDDEALPSTAEVFDALGRTVASRWQGSSLVFRPETPGAYRIGVPDGPTVALVAVNIGPEESDVRRGPGVAAVEAELAPELFQRADDLGMPLLWFAGCMMALSSVLARARRETAVELTQDA